MTLKYRQEEKCTLCPSMFSPHCSGFDFCLLMTRIEQVWHMFNNACARKMLLLLAHFFLGHARKNVPLQKE